MRNRILVGVALFLGSLMPLAAAAHVVVEPGEVGVGSFQTFAVGVPDEKDQAVTGLRLVIPAGLTSVSPNVKPGWTIDEKKTGEGEDAIVTEISWTGGQIPAGQRDDFVFSAQVPAKTTILPWKAYQTYADGTVVSWDQTPNGKDDESLTPYSTTKVIDDLAASNTADATAKEEKRNEHVALELSIVALALAVVALLRKR